MVTWDLLTDDVARHTWDQHLLTFEDCSPWQLHAWGEYNRSLGWQPCRWVARADGGAIVAMVQGLLRRYPPGIGLVWCDGGPVGDLTACDARLQRAMVRTTGRRRLYCRMRVEREARKEDAADLARRGWTRGRHQLTSDRSMLLAPLPNESALLAQCARNWRRNFRHARANCLTIRQWHAPEVDEIAAVYAGMESFKRLDEQFSRAELRGLLEHCSQHILLYRGDDEQGRAVALRGCAIAGSRAWDLFAAATERGRALRASYPLLCAVLEHCRALGVRSYDLSGIDPVRNPGVYRFKAETGAAPVEYLGEWDWATSRWMQQCGDVAMVSGRWVRQAEMTIASLREAWSWQGRTVRARLGPN